MKRFFSMVCVLLYLSAGMMQAETKSDYVEVLYFHGKQRCSTCVALERCAQEVVYTDFAEQVQAGKVCFRSVDISTKEGGELGKTYKVSWSALYVNGWKDGRETRHDLTQAGFRYVGTQPDVFKQRLREEINELLK